MADNPTPADLTEQRSEAMAELVKALLIINGGGAVALLAFLQSAWVQDNRLVVPVACAVGFLAFGSLFAAACHLLRYYASWHHQKGDDTRWARFRRFYLLFALASLSVFGIGVVVIVGSVVCSASQ
jgi:hypothetical protein